MKRFIIVVALATLVSAPPAVAQYYGWTISKSSFDPYVNTGGVVGTLDFLYLWLACSPIDGLTAAEFDLAYTPAGLGLLVAVTTQNGFLNAGSGNALLLATACRNGPVVAAQLIVQALAPGQWCVVASAVNGLNVGVDCTNFLTWDNASIGCSMGGAPLTCHDGTPLCYDVAVESETWGGIKSFYH